MAQSIEEKDEEAKERKMEDEVESTAEIALKAL